MNKRDIKTQENSENKIPLADDRVQVLEKIAQYEREGKFDIDVEQDPESKVLMPDDICYLDKRLLPRIKNKIAFASAGVFFKKALKNKLLILNDTVGAENLLSAEGGAIITCNHFNAFDSFVMQYVFDDSHHKGKMYRIIREGNYTSFPGFYGFLMRNCNTLPLSSNLGTMRKFLRAVRTALKEGNCVLIYPEQSMWWNYRKPKPLKEGAFDMAVQNGVPVVPCFITMQDSDIIGSDGYPVQIYTPFVGKPIYPDFSLGKKEARTKMMREHDKFTRKVYEDFYKIPLTYTTQIQDGK